MSTDAAPGGQEIVMPPDGDEGAPDLHVVSLTYSMTKVDGVSYESPPPVVFETDEAQFRLEDARLTCRMKNHFSTTEDARAVVELLLRA